MKVALRGTLLAATLGLVSCGPRAEPIVISRLLVNGPPALDAVPTQRESIRAGVVHRLERDSSVSYRVDDLEGTHVLLIEVGSRTEADGTESADEAALRLRVRLRPTSRAPNFEAVGEGAKAGSEAERALAAFDDAWGVIARQRRLEVSPTRDLVAALGDQDNRLRLFAIQRAGERRAAEAAEPLMKLVSNEAPPEVALRAMGALAHIGDPRAAGPIIELARNKDPIFVLQAVFALGAVGGPTAEGYLVTLASGHPVEGVRRGAADALAELQRRGARPAKPSP